MITGTLATACGGSGTSSSSSSSSSPAVTSTVAPTTTLAATTSSTLAASTPAGFTGFTDAPNRFTISFPADWRSVDPSSAGAAQVLKDLAKSNPGLGALAAGDLAAQGIKFLAADGSGASVNVVVKPAVGARDSDLPAVIDQAKAEYAKLGATVKTSGDVRLAGRSGVRLSLDLKLNLPDGGTSTVPEVQYFVFANDLAYIVTQAGTSPRFQAIIDTFRVS